jgi:hypothetical protein
MMLNSPEILSARNESEDNLTKDSRGGKDDRFNNDERLEAIEWHVLPGV